MYWTSDKKFSAKFSFTIPSEAAKKAKMFLMKYLSLSFNFSSQSTVSCCRSISSAVQKEACCFLYICQMSLWMIGKRTKRFGFSCKIGSLKISCWDSLFVVFAPPGKASSMFSSFSVMFLLSILRSLFLLTSWNSSNKASRPFLNNSLITCKTDT